MPKKKAVKHMLMKGSGANHHSLHGVVDIPEHGENEFYALTVQEDAHLKHETPTGEFAEHNTLLVEKGEWFMGKQVEFNPFDNTVVRIWD
jgi:hypothetical protein